MVSGTKNCCRQPLPDAVRPSSMNNVWLRSGDRFEKPVPGAFELKSSRARAVPAGPCSCSRSWARSGPLSPKPLNSLAMIADVPLTGLSFTPSGLISCLRLVSWPPGRLLERHQGRLTCGSPCRGRTRWENQPSSTTGSRRIRSITAKRNPTGR